MAKLRVRLLEDLAEPVTDLPPLDRPDAPAINDLARSWVQDGYAILRGLIPTEPIDAYCARFLRDASARVIDSPPLPIRNRACVNPGHLEQVTAYENMRRGEGFAADKLRQTHCVRGHDLAAARVRADGGRVCRACRRERYAERRAA